ncbi:flagellar basal body P-ring protein FlgI [Magnetospirillum molischianum]|uniref:Flagellar P-ring protein n=1 Tax=Magnetospirillum molischianum DSM 120 TaxID=1150626 RepID=H8FVZ3_MAGML|nr:flagellar basal body P-ring protein FlgI [Magnetospirillum molischianum]CCG42531.1 Flagellar P-ring protein [Magnetospirillum molischianum DSM 120]
MRFGPTTGLLAALLLATSFTPTLAQQVRVKDIASVGGMAEAGFTGFGMVVGLSGTGDSRPPGPGAAFPSGRDSAVVMVTARLAPGLRVGSRVDVTVAATGDARSLAGGTLVPTALEGGDRRIYAVAEGPVAAAGSWAGGIAASVTRGSPTTGTISGGATIERDLPLALGAEGEVRFLLRRPDFTTARRLAEAINASLGRKLARPLDNAAVSVAVPPDYPDGAAGLIATAENAVLTPDRSGRSVVIDSRTGAIVAGLDIPLAPVAISHGDMTIRVQETPQVSQPAPFSSGGKTVIVPRSSVEIDETGRMVAMPAGGTVGDLLNALTKAGMSALDRIAVLQAVRAAGGFDAELVAR